MLKITLARFKDVFLYFLNKVKHTSVYIKVASRLFALLLFTSLFHSCVKDDLDFDKLETTNWSPSLALPLAYSSMSIEDLLKNEQDSGLLQIDPDKFCTLIYTGRALEIKAGDLVTIPDQHMLQTIQLNAAIANAINTVGEITFNYSQNIDFSMQGGMELDSTLFKGGNIQLEFNSQITANTSIDITILGATLNGIPFSQNVQLNYTGTVPVTATINPGLAGYRFDFTRGGITTNQLQVDYTVYITTTGATVQSWHKADIDFNFVGNDYKEAYGYFGQQNLLSPDDTINITLFRTQQGLGTFTIAEPEIKIDLVNSLGLPVRANVIQMTGLNGDLTSLVVATGIPSPLPIVYPSLSQVGQTMTGTFTMSNANSNIAAMIANKPLYVISQVQSITNPNGNTEQNFVTDSSGFAIDMEVKLPLYGTAKDFLLKDTVNFNYNNLNNVEELMVRTALTNGFPFDVNFQLFFTDDNYMVLDSLVYTNQLLMPAGNVSAATGRVTSPTTKTTDHTLDRTRVLKIMNAKKLILKASASTVNNGTTDVRIYSDYKFDVNLGAIAKVKL